LRRSLSLYQRRLVDSKHELPAELDQALQYTLQLVSGHPEFERHAFQACDVIIGSWKSRSPSAIHAVCKIALQWQPVRWFIPTEFEISAVDNIMCKSDEGPGGQVTVHYEVCCQYKRFFSATAVAINYLETHAKQRAMMRHIILVEDRMSVSNSERHLEGYLRFRDDNPTLRVVRNIGLWSSIYYYSWSQLQQLLGQSTPLDGVDKDLYPKLARPVVAHMLPGLAE
jgi:hypothetical protein